MESSFMVMATALTVKYLAAYSMKYSVSGRQPAGDLKLICISLPTHYERRIVDGESLLVSSPEIATPFAARNTRVNFPDGCNLFNAADFPEPPYCTDDPNNH
jgi:hypothetical protein